METKKKQLGGSGKVLESLISKEPKEGPYGIVIPLDESEMILKNVEFSIMESFPDLKSADPTFTLRIILKDDDLQNFQKLEKMLAEIAMENKEKVKVLSQTVKSDDPEIDFKNAANYDEKSFRLIRENSELWGKLYHNQRTFEITTTFWRLHGKKRRKVTNPNTLIGSKLIGNIHLELKQIFMAKHKAITCIAHEGLVMVETKPVSAFDEFEEEEL